RQRDRAPTRATLEPRVGRLRGEPNEKRLEARALAILRGDLVEDREARARVAARRGAARPRRERRRVRPVDAERTGERGVGGLARRIELAPDVADPHPRLGILAVLGRGLFVR